MNKEKVLNITVLIFILIYFIGLLSLEHKSFGLEHSPLPLKPWMKKPLKDLIWVIFVLYAVDLSLKYNQIKNSKKFVKKHWWDISLLLLIPIFSKIKLFKLAPKVIKKLNTLKTSHKVVRKTRKIKVKK